MRKLQGKTYEAKGRPSDNPLIVHIADIQALDEIVESIPERAKSIAEKFWPGPLTLIFEKTWGGAAWNDWRATNSGS